MYTRVKTEAEIDAMRVGGRILAAVLANLKEKVQPGVTAKELDAIAEREIKRLGATAAFRGYQGFPGSICISVNDEVVHGIPKAETVLKSGDVVSLDLGVIYRGLIVDSAITVICGGGTSEVQNLLRYTEDSLNEGLAQIKDGVRTGDIGYAIEKVLTKHNLGIVRDLVGHGVGHAVHEDPNIPNYGRRHAGSHLVKGMTVAIEPMATLGKEAVIIDPDGWTVRTADGSLAAHFEHTVLITEDGCEILTEL